MRISDWSSDVCSADLALCIIEGAVRHAERLEDLFLHRAIIGGTDLHLRIEKVTADIARGRSHLIIILEQVAELAGRHGIGKLVEGGGSRCAGVGEDEGIIISLPTGAGGEERGDENRS